MILSDNVHSESNNNLSNEIKTSTFKSRVKIEDVVSKSFYGNSPKKEDKTVETVTLRCDKCGNSWIRKLDGNKVVYYSDAEVEKCKRKALQYYHKDIKINFGALLGVLFFGFLTYLCASYCINHDSTYIVHQQAFLWIEEKDVETTDLWWYVCLFFSIGLGSITLLFLMAFLPGLFQEQSSTYKQIDKMNTGQFRNSEYMEVFLKR